MDPVTLGAAMAYTDESLLGGGAIKGKNAVIQSITKVDGGNEVVFRWTLDDGTVQTATMFVEDGKTAGTGNVYCPDYDTIFVMDKAAFDALLVKDPRTKYEIKG